MTCNLKITKSIHTKGSKDTYNKVTKCKGPVKPLLMFYGEPMPARIAWGLDKISDYNWKQPENPLNDNEKQEVQKGGGCDLLLIIGSNMDQYPMNEIINIPSNDCPKVLIDIDSNINKPYF